MQLCMTTHVRFYRACDGYYCQPGFNRFLQTAAPLFTRVVLCVPVSDRPTSKTTVLVNLPNLSICELPLYGDRWEVHALRHPIRLMRRLWTPVRDADAVWILLPNYLSILVWTVCLLQGKRFAIRMVGDWPAMLRMAFGRRGLGWVGWLVGGAHQLLLHTMVRTADLTLTTGPELARTYGRGVRRTIPFVSSTVSACEIAKTITENNTEEHHILFVGRVDAYKGIRELLLAARDLLAEGHRLRIRIVGKGVHEDSLQVLAKDLGIAQQVDWRGWVGDRSELRREYRTADVFALPSYAEGSPKVVIEAMANGLPVVATNVGAVPLVIQNGRTGLVVPAQNADALRDALRKLLLDKSLRQRMARAGMARSALFTMEAERERINDAFFRFGLFGTHETGHKQAEANDFSGSGASMVAERSCDG